MNPFRHNLRGREPVSELDRRKQFGFNEYFRYKLLHLFGIRADENAERFTVILDFVGSKYGHGGAGYGKAVFSGDVGCRIQTVAVGHRRRFDVHQISALDG